MVDVFCVLLVVAVVVSLVVFIEVVSIVVDVDEDVLVVEFVASVVTVVLSMRVDCVAVLADDTLACVVVPAFDFTPFLRSGCFEYAVGQSETV